MNEVRHWAVVPAAGLGKRLGDELPKQYLQLAGQPLLQWTLNRMLAWPFLRSIIVALHPEDRYFPKLSLSAPQRVSRVEGGAERSDSVLAGLLALEGTALESDWVWVHDAVRPCIPRACVESLCLALADEAVGALLALPASDTVKFASLESRVEQTLDRSRVWLAQTPQVFRFGVLYEALQRARREGWLPTDEAAAIERCGLQPVLVQGSPANLKVTRREDLEFAANYLREH